MSDLYLRVREKEGRLYPDAILARLPEAPRDDPHSEDWRCRADSCTRLTRYLSARKQPLSILELGCGNGWLSHRLAQVLAAQVWGLDLYNPELIQAGRVFLQSNLLFLTADIFHPPFVRQGFDEIVVASAIQYFPDLPKLIHGLKPHLKPDGEIHLLDSPFYRPEELPAAKERTRAYYAALGFPEMAEHYYHHAYSELQQFTPKWLYRPNSFFARIQRLSGKSLSPFPWVVIK